MFNLSTLVTLFLIFWFISVNLPFVYHPRDKKLGRGKRCLAWIGVTVLCFALSYWLDKTHITAPHSPWSESPIYMVFGALSALFAAPGFIYYEIKRPAK